MMIQRILLYCTYRGSRYRGWQKQKNCPDTIQEILETALAKVALHPVKLVGCGRTDKKVHALLQTAHFDTTASRPLTAWVAGVNQHLPADIAVLAARPVDSSFHARHQVSGRAYRYILYSAPVRPVLLRNQVGWTFLPMDTAAMNNAAKLLLGVHDFSAFRGADCTASSPVKNLSRCEVYLWHNLIYCDFAADGFLQHMIRNIVGALVWVGSGKWSGEDMANLLRAKDRRYAPPTFAPAGLYFLGACYPAVWGLTAPVPEPGFWGDKAFGGTD